MLCRFSVINQKSYQMQYFSSIWHAQDCHLKLYQTKHFRRDKWPESTATNFRGRITVRVSSVFTQAATEGVL